MTNHLLHPENPKDAVLGKIRAGAVTMRPRLYFILKAFAVAFIAALVLALSILLASFIFFAIRLNGSDALLSFGPRGLPVFLEIFPWPLALADLGLIVLLEWLLRRFRFAYSRPVLFLLLAIVAIVGAISVGIEHSTRFHESLFAHAEHEGLPPPFQSFYIGAHQHAPESLGVFRGIVVSEEAGRFVITYDDIDTGTTTEGDADAQTRIIVVPDGFDISVIHIGDRVFVAGDYASGTVRAYGIRVLPPRPHE